VATPRYEVEDEHKYRLESRIALYCPEVDPELPLSNAGTAVDSHRREDRSARTEGRILNPQNTPVPGDQESGFNITVRKRNGPSVWGADAHGVPNRSISPGQVPPRKSLQVSLPHPGFPPRMSRLRPCPVCAPELAGKWLASLRSRRY
jgi:hypothetical protein